jgi:hypothetical protein
MFDYVKCRAMLCPGCGGDLGWQTKSGPPTLSDIYVMQIMCDADEMSMIGECEDCGWFVDVSIRRDRSMTIGQRLQLESEKQEAADRQ